MKGIALVPFIIILSACGYVNRNVVDYNEAPAQTSCCPAVAGTAVVNSCAPVVRRPCCPAVAPRPVVSRPCVVEAPVVTSPCCSSAVQTPVVYHNGPMMDVDQDVTVTSTADFY